MLLASFPRPSWRRWLVCVGLLCGASHAQSPEAKAVLINREDLAALGCEVESDSGIFIQQQGTRILNFRNKRGCVVNVTSSVSVLAYAKRNAEELWSAVEENVEHMAKKCKCTPVHTRDTAGVRSELYEFPGQGKWKAFKYVVQDRGVLYEVTVHSEQIAMSPELKTIVNSKIGLVAEQVSANPAD